MRKNHLIFGLQVEFAYLIVIFVVLSILPVPNGLAVCLASANNTPPASGLPRGTFLVTPRTDPLADSGGVSSVEDSLLPHCERTLHHQVLPQRGVRVETGDAVGVGLLSTPVLSG